MYKCLSQEVWAMPQSLSDLIDKLSFNSVMSWINVKNVIEKSKCTQDSIVGHEIDADIVTVHKTLTNQVNVAIFQRKEYFNFF